MPPMAIAHPLAAKTAEHVQAEIRLQEAERTISRMISNANYEEEEREEAEAIMQL